MLNSYIKKYCQEFDEEFSKFINDDSKINEYNKLINEINNDVQLQGLVEEQRMLQQELMNLRALKQFKFSVQTEKKLQVIDSKLQSDERLIQLRRYNHLIELERDIISDELQEWKGNYVFKN